jgi:hypothetical protein
MVKINFNVYTQYDAEVRYYFKYMFMLSNIMQKSGTK